MAQVSARCAAGVGRGHGFRRRALDHHCAGATDARPGIRLCRARRRAGGGLRPPHGAVLRLMIVVANLRLSGFFRLVAGSIATRAHHPLMLLAAVTFSSGLFSAFLLNDAICLVMTPLVIDIVMRLKRDPVPYLLAVAMASNVGSAATITGNPQNILIGSFSGISYGTFAAQLSPPAAIGLVLTIVLLALTYRSEFFGGDEELTVTATRVHMHRWLATKSILVVIAMMAAFFAGQPPVKVGLIAGASYC